MTQKLENVIRRRFTDTIAQIEPIIRQRLKIGEITDDQCDRIKVVLDIFKEEVVENVGEIISDQSIYNLIDLIEESEDEDNLDVFDDAA